MGAVPYTLGLYQSKLMVDIADYFLVIRIWDHGDLATKNQKGERTQAFGQ